jgi:hypothetical protein
MAIPFEVIWRVHPIIGIPGSIELEESKPCLIRVASKGVYADAWRIIQRGRRRKHLRRKRICDDFATHGKEPTMLFLSMA